MSDTKVTASASAGGIGFCGLLTIAFIILKLCGVITWKWIWVFSPLWIGFSVFILLVVFVMIIAYTLSKWINHS